MKPAETSFILPDLVSNCPFPVAYHPSGDTIDAESATWFDISCPELSDKRRKALYGLKGGALAAFCYSSPDIPDSRLRVVADYLNYLFHLDNISDGMLTNDTQALSDAVMNALRFPDVEPENELNAAKLARDFWGRCIRGGDAGPGFQRRFKESLQLYFNTTLVQAQARDEESILDLESYIEFARDNSGCKTTFAFIEYAHGVDLPDFVVKDPIMEALNQAANDVVAWSNDIWSYNAEQSRHDAQDNMITILMKYHGHTLQSAVDYVGDLCHQTINDFVQNSKNVPHWGPEVDDIVKRYIRGLEDWIVGTIHWSFDSTRYFGNYGQEVKRTRLVKLLPVSEENKW
ncbi:hypothetical protein GYMLUDRAFT_181084 [Collybiopsis luxurians FD-317 M1]|uniref:Terpene synthase n=1 Tax=Collybiopsis luxurians FD-317 M1 TaxID=944289 RepID=A0A0D0ANB7_9AGAR|nr:hypothetical protein GYMLUDRAFT_181084 [Collybiopsis luxurians FD-317 M1]